MKLIMDFIDIEKCQADLVETLLNIEHEDIYVTVGFHGGSYKGQVHWFSDLGFWFLPVLIRGSRYWNAFGTEKPTYGASLSITCEVNFPVEGVQRQIAGALVKNNDNIYIVHRGRIGGSKKGGGKQLFLKHFRGAWVEIEEDGPLTNAALVGSLYSDKFPEQIKQFIYEIKRIKSTLEEVLQDVPDPMDREFAEEFFGKKKYSYMKHVIDAKCNHGLVVSHLAAYLISKGFKVANNVLRDLYILDSEKQMKAIFEVKTDILRDSLYSGVGQLLLNNNHYKGNPKLFLLVPDKPPTLLIENMNRAGIKVATYTWKNNYYEFYDLSI